MLTPADAQLMEHELVFTLYQSCGLLLLHCVRVNCDRFTLLGDYLNQGDCYF